MNINDLSALSPADEGRQRMTARAFTPQKAHIPAEHRNLNNTFLTYDFSSGQTQKEHLAAKW